MAAECRKSDNHMVCFPFECAGRVNIDFGIIKLERRITNKDLLSNEINTGSSPPIKV